MTHDVLQSDIDLAHRLLDARRPADEIVTALTCRGVDSSRAARLIAEIQSGKTVEPDRPITINIPGKRTEATVVAAEQLSRQNLRGDSSSDRLRNHSEHRKPDAFPWAMIIALTAALLCVAAFAIISRKSHTESANKAAGDPRAESHIAGGQPGAKEISLEIQRDGLRLCDNWITRENFMSAVFKLLGTPSRTNQIEKLDHVIYAYDSYGLLVYSPNRSGNCSVVLDFEGTAGPAGTRNPFAGIFKINNYTVHAATDAASLALIKELELEPPKFASGILRAQFGGLELVFAYFNSPERLSLAEIDFR